MSHSHHVHVAEALDEQRQSHWPDKIRKRKSLHKHLQTAIMLEHATIPAYLTALYSIKNADNSDAGLVLRSVVIEEMLHLTLAANVLNAVGGSPKINRRKFVPKYPTRLPHSANRFEVSTERFSPSAVETFMRIEHPGKGPVEEPQPDEYDTIGQFYLAIEEGLTWLCDKHGEKEIFTGAADLQIRPQDYYGSGGRIIEVKNLATAIAAIREIIDQGEGAWKENPVTGKDHRVIWEDPNGDLASPHDQASHFFRFDEIRQGRYYDVGDEPGRPSGERLRMDWDAVWPIRANTRASDFQEGTEIRELLDDFNRAYNKFLAVLHQSFNGSRGMLKTSVPMMYDLKYRAQAIARVPIPGSDENVGPSWEWVPG